MNYIGSKVKLTKFIEDAIISCAGDIKEATFCDLFAGTGAIGKAFKSKVRTVISNDLEAYSYVLIRNYIGNNETLHYESLIEELNEIAGKAGIIYNNYCSGSGSKRQYFTDDNGKKIDAIRQNIEKWYKDNKIGDNEYYFLLASLLESADKVANTASVYAAFLKKIKRSAQKELVMLPALYPQTQGKHTVFNEDANLLIRKISGDILYLDPPYNSRQYGNYYHILNTIAKYDRFVPKGITGMRQYNRSLYCKKRGIHQAFIDLIEQAQFKYIFLSYNNEGLMSDNSIKEIMQKYGKYHLVTTEHQRFKSDKDSNRTHKAKKTTEYLHILEK
jgi:adenine-specific DNA-methyltransferase